MKTKTYSVRLTEDEIAKVRESGGSNWAARVIRAALRGEEVPAEAIEKLRKPVFSNLNMTEPEAVHVTGVGGTMTQVYGVKPEDRHHCFCPGLTMEQRTTVGTHHTKALCDWRQ